MPVMSRVERAFCCGAMWRTTTRAVLDILPTDRLGEQLLEIGSGSGAIALGLQDFLPSADITAVEWHNAAFLYLEKNILNYGN